MLHDANGEPLAPIPFGGIYLPLECDIKKCYNYPLVLTYDAAHFSALVLMEEDNFTMNENEPPYSIMPITYSNLDLLPIHFSYDPGSNFDWSKCQQTINDDTASISNNSATNKSSSNQTDKNNRNKNSISNSSVNIKDMELNRDQKMHLLQSYLNLVKIQLVNQNCVSLVDIYVEQKVSKYSATSSMTPSPTGSNGTVNGKKFSKSNSTFKKIMNIFRRDNSAYRNSSDGKNVNLKHYHQESYHFNNYNNSGNNSNNYKKYQFKSWNQLFDTLNPETCILAARLSLEKPSKYDKIIHNYIESARNKFEIIKREQKQFAMQQHHLQQQNNSSNLQQQNLLNKKCTYCGNLCTSSNDLCKNCSCNQNEMIITHH